LQKCLLKPNTRLLAQILDQSSEFHILTQVDTTVLQATAMSLLCATNASTIIKLPI